MVKQLAIYDTISRRLEGLDPGQATAVGLPAFKIQNGLPQAGTVDGEAVLDASTGIPYIYSRALGWTEIALPVIIHEADDATILNNNYPDGSVILSEGSGNLWTKGPSGLLALGLRVYPTKAALTSDTAAPDGTLGFSVDDGGFSVRTGGVWAGLSNQGVTVGTAAPPTPVAGNSWLDTSGAKPALKIWDGNSWFNNSSTAAPVGSIIMFPNYSAPPGYMLCDGRAVSQSAYPLLHAIVGNNVPNLTDQFIRGARNNSDAQGKVRHQDTTRMPRVPFYAESNGSHKHSGIYDYGATGGSSGGDAMTGTPVANFAHGWRGQVNDLLHADGAHVHNIRGGDPESAPVHVRLAYVIKHD